MGSRLDTGARIVGWNIVLAVCFGLLHDIFSAHMCLEYFTFYHPPLIASQNVWVQAIFWGVFATWWVGAIGGVVMAFASQAGKWKPLTIEETMKPCIRLAIGLLILAPIVWFSIYAFGGYAQGLSTGSEVTELDKRVMASGVMHLVSYNIAGLGYLTIALILCIQRIKSN